MKAATAAVCRSGWLGDTAKSMTGRKQSKTEPTRYGTSLRKLRSMVEAGLVEECLMTSQGLHRYKGIA